MDLDRPYVDGPSLLRLEGSKLDVGLVALTAGVTIAVALGTRRVDRAWSRRSG